MSEELVEPMTTLLWKRCMGFRKFGSFSFTQSTCNTYVCAMFCRDKSLPETGRAHLLSLTYHNTIIVFFPNITLAFRITWIQLVGVSRGWMRSIINCFQQFSITPCVVTLFPHNTPNNLVDNTYSWDKNESYTNIRLLRKQKGRGNLIHTC